MVEKMIRVGIFVNIILCIIALFYFAATDNINAAGGFFCASMGWLAAYLENKYNKK